MKKIVISLLLVISGMTAFSQINWVSFERAMAQSKQDGKPVLVDVYTDWCGWCKRLDATTYQDSAVIAYINANFHAVKFNAEGSDKISYHDSLFTNTGKTHDLAKKLLNGKLSYPTTIFMVEKFNMVAPIPGYLTRETIQPYLFYFGEKVYEMNTTWESFMKGFMAPKFK